MKMGSGGVLCVTPSGKTPTSSGRLSRERGSSGPVPPPHASETFGMRGLRGPSLGGKRLVTSEISFPGGVPGRRNTASQPGTWGLWTPRVPEPLLKGHTECAKRTAILFRPRFPPLSSGDQVTVIPPPGALLRIKWKNTYERKPKKL